jgi:hypothetical protein
MFYITARALVNSLVCEMKSDLPDSLGSEPNHTAHDLPGVETFSAFESPKLISENGII